MLMKAGHDYPLVESILCPCPTDIFEYLNYDKNGSLINYISDGAVRKPLEYDLKLIEPYHKCMSLFMDNIVVMMKDNLWSVDLKLNMKTKFTCYFLEAIICNIVTNVDKTSIARQVLGHEDTHAN